MAGFVVIDTSEVHALAGEMRAYCDAVQPIGERIVAKTAHDIVARAQVLAPFEFGTLRNSIGATVTGLDAEIGPTVEYGEYQELGTDRMAPSPFLAPAFDEKTPKAVEAFGQLGERILR